MMMTVPSVVWLPMSSLELPPAEQSLDLALFYAVAGKTKPKDLRA